MVPWQLVAARTGAVLKHVNLTPNGQEIDMKVGHVLGQRAEQGRQGRRLHACFAWRRGAGGTALAAAG